MPIRRFGSLSSSDSASERPSKRPRSDSIASEWDGHSNCKLKVSILQPKLDEKTITHLYDLVDAHAPESQNDGSEHLELVLCNDIKDADVIITGIRMRKRLERHVDWNIAVGVKPPLAPLLDSQSFYSDRNLSLPRTGS